MIGAGSLDRLVKLQSATVTNDANSNEPIKTWATYATVYAMMEFHKTDETEGLSRLFAERGLFMTIRCRADVLPEHRILYSQPDTQLDEAYEIIGRPREIGRRQYMKIQVRLVE